MRIKERRTNAEEIKPIPVPTVDPEKILGYSYLPKLFCNTFICAKKNSGKTYCIWKIIEKCTDKRTKIFIFSTTVFKDASWDFILGELDKRKIEYETFTEIAPLRDIINHYKGSDEDEQEGVESQPEILSINTRRILRKKRRRSLRKKVPSYCSSLTI